MNRVISISLGEGVLKGTNRRFIVNRILQQIRNVLKDFNYENLRHEMGKIYLDIDESEEDEIIDKLKYVFGIVYIIPSWEMELSYDEIKEASGNYLKELLQHGHVKTFKVETHRANKNFPKTSPEISREVGAAILRKNPELKVDLHHPDVLFQIDIRGKAYLYHEKIPAYGGMPLGTNGKGLLLLSGGIDSPVAGFLMAKRGMTVHGLHFHSYPFTSPQAEEKVLALAGILAKYSIEFNVYSVNILNIQKAINQNCPPEQMTLLSRRFMMRIANEIARRDGFNAIITGENLGQVASQTIEGLTVINDAAEPVVFRPLIGMDKVDIIDWAERIGTYPISIQPFEDCCTVFLPNHPLLHPTIQQMEISEKELAIDALVQEAVDEMIIHKIEVKE